MKKIISLFQRNYETDHLVRDEVVPGAEWVLAGEGIATRKWDGTCCLVRGGKLYKRYDHKPDNWKAIQRALKAGKEVPDPIFSPPPEDFEPAQDPDPVTLHWPGWVPVTDSNEDRWHREAWQLHLEYVSEWALESGELDGTYELCGPKVGGNPESFTEHVLIRHGTTLRPDCPRTVAELKEYLRNEVIEGIVWHHPDGRMVKIKKSDFWGKR